MQHECVSNMSKRATSADGGGGMHLATKGALIDFAVLGAREWQPVVLQLPHRLGRLPAHVLDSVLRIDTVEMREHHLQGLWSLVRGFTVRATPRATPSACTRLH